MPRTHQSTQRKGTIAALSVGALFLAVIAWFFFRGGHAPDQQPEPFESLADPASHTGPPGPDPQLMASEGFRGDIMDRKDPTRKAGEVRYATMDPLPGHRWAVQQPDAFFFLKDGRTLHIRADKGDLYVPDQRKEPEAGTISGHVVGTLFEPRPDGTRIDPAVDPPAFTFRTASLTFDVTLETLSTDERVEVESEGLSFAGRGLRAVFNQLRERLESLTIKDQGRLALRPGRTGRDRPAASAVKAGSPSPAPAPAGAQAAARPRPAPIETIYHTLLEGDVKVVSGGREVDADRLDLWARLLDGELPPNAIAQIRAARPAAHGAATPPTGVPVPAAEKPAGGPPTPPTATPATEPDESEIVLTWSGPCTITPLDEAPPELKPDFVALRMTSPARGAVLFADKTQNGTGHARAVEYAATTGKLTLIGDEKDPARFAFADGRGLETRRIEADLLHGLVHIPGAGILRNDDRHEGGATWEKQADFIFAVRAGALTGDLLQATFDGSFRGTQKDGALTGGFARADFTPTPDRPVSLTRLIVEGNAVAETRKHADGPAATSGRVSGDRLDASFAPSADGKNPDLRAVTVLGHAVAEQGPQRLTAERIEAVLDPGPHGPEIASATAAGSVHYTEAQEQVTADAGQMRADFGFDARLGKRRQIVDLWPGVVLARRDESTVTGDQVRLDGQQNRIDVFGAGTFEHRDQKTGRITASWTDGMVYDDAAGQLDCYGDAVALATPDPLKAQRLEAGRLRIDLAPRAEATSEGLDDLSKRLRRSVATGSILDRERGQNARATIEEFEPDPAAPDGRRRVRLQYLEGATIIADHILQTLDVPGPGRLLLVDRADASPGTPQSALGSPGVAPGAARGDALFDWDGSLHADQRTATMEMKRNVRMTHRDLRQDQVINLDCDALTARAESAKGGKLQSATAQGAVFVTLGPPAIAGQPRPRRKELVADRAEFDADQGLIEASAAPGALVTFFDPERGSVATAAGLTWELRQDRIVITRPGPVTGGVPAR